MRRLAAVAVAVGLMVGTFLVAPGASAGTSATPDRKQPVLAISANTTCAIRESQRVYCFGANSSGELGRGNTSPATTVAPVDYVSLDDAIAVYGAPNSPIYGGSFCALRSNRTVACWGNGNAQVLGTGSSSDATVPTTIPGLTNVASVGMGLEISCFVKQDGTVWCVGDGSGFGGTSWPTPHKIPGLASVTAVAVGDLFACALKIDKSVWCWGTNIYGALGTGSWNSSSTPVRVVGLSDAAALVAGAGHACAIRTAGTVVCWGDDQFLTLGHVPVPQTGFGAGSLVPVSVNGVTGAKAIAADTLETCVATTTVVKCWGNGSGYRLGDGQTYSQAGAVTATAGLPRPTGIAVGSGTACEVADGGRVWCWGSNSAGEGGTGSTSALPSGGGPGNTFGFALAPRAIALTNAAPGKPMGSSTLAHKIKVSWSAPSNANGTSAPKDYVVYYQLKGSTTWKKFTDSISTSRTTTVTGLTTGKYYRFKVVPKNWAGAGMTSAVSAYIKSR